MEKIINIISAFLIFITLGCSSSENRKASVFSGCLENDQAVAITQFSDNLKKILLKTNDTSVPEVYKNYLTAAGYMQLPEELFGNIILQDDFKQLKSSGFFSDSRAKLSEVEQEQEENELFDEIEVLEYDLSAEDREEEKKEEARRQELAEKMTAYKPNSDYIECLASITQSKLILTYTQRLKEGIVINPSLLATALLDNLKDEDYSDPVVQSFIALHIHTEFMFMMGDN